VKHTPEPWAFGDIEPHSIVTGKQQRIVHRPIDRHDQFTRAELERIVACVNACAGVPNEQLRRMNLAGAIAHVQSAYSDHWPAVDQQCMEEKLDAFLQQPGRGYECIYDARSKHYNFVLYEGKRQWQAIDSTREQALNAVLVAFNDDTSLNPDDLKHPIHYGD
jgi:hypothetical protein